MANAPFHLERFVSAQAAVYDRALAELRAGAKRTHWVWFIFPQLAGLGSSEMAVRYAIRSLGEARAYLAQPVLGPRLRECVETMQGLAMETADTVLGGIDAMKFRSSLTLFREAGGGPLFDAALDRWFGGVADPATLTLLGGDGQTR